MVFKAWFFREGVRGVDRAASHGYTNITSFASWNSPQMALVPIGRKAPEKVPKYLKFQYLKSLKTQKSKGSKI